MSDTLYFVFMLKLNTRINLQMQNKCTRRYMCFMDLDGALVILYRIEIILLLLNSRGHRVRRDFFICWITLPAYLKNWDSTEITERIILKRHSVLVNYVKIMFLFLFCFVLFFWFFFFFLAIADLKNFSWCNVIQQIKTLV